MKYMREGPEDSVLSSKWRAQKKNFHKEIALEVRNGRCKGGSCSKNPDTHIKGWWGGEHIGKPEVFAQR